MQHIIAFGGRNLGKITSQKKLSWEDFRDQYLSDHTVVDVTVRQFHRLSRERRAKIKNKAGWFVGGGFGRNERRVYWRSRTTLQARSLISLDIDHLSKFDRSVSDVVNTLEILNLTFSLYATPSSTEDDIRLRLVMPVDQALRPEHYQPIARWVASQIDIDIFDHTGFEECRLMYLPVRLSDSPAVIEHFDGDPLCRDEILGSYEDWRDANEWPSSETEGGARQPHLKAEDPRLKRGVVGAFCRAFNVHDVMEQWLGEHFTRVDDNTYRPIDSTGAPGARVYDDQMFLYNNHETGVTSQKNLNAFDLVRLCLFYDRDDDVLDRDRAITSLPSYRAMVDFALQQPKVHQEMYNDEFSSFENETSDSQRPTTYDDIAESIAELTTGNGSRQELRTLMVRIANARFSPTDERSLLRQLSVKYPSRMSMTVLESEIKDIRRSSTTQDDTGEIHDLELELIQAFEEEYYPNNTIKRIGRVFWTFRNGLWQMVDDEIIYGQFAQTVIRLRKERPDDVQEIAAMVGEHKTSALLGSLHRMMNHVIAQRDCQDDPLQLMRRYDKPVINCRNCELHFDSNGRMTVHDHAPEHFYTVRIDAEYDPDATCPLFDQFLEHTFSNAENPEGMIRFAEELGGYTIQMSRWLKIWVMCYGPTNTGKTTYSEILTSLLGNAAIEKKLEFLKPSVNKTGQYVGLVGKLLFLDDDMDKGAILPDGDIKRISEEKAIQTDVKYGGDIRFVCHAFPMVCTNHWPRTRDMTDAFVQRTLVLPFSNPYTIGVDANDQIKAAMLRDERPGILNRFIAGLSRLRQRGRFDLPVDSEKALQQWLQNANPIAGFLANCVTSSGKDEIRTSSLYDMYVGWHNDEYGYGGKPIPKQEFFRRCETQLGARGSNRYGYTVFRGYRLIESSELQAFNSDDDFEDVLGDLL